MASTLKLELGALCDPISKQLAGHLPAKTLGLLDAMNDAITTCYVHGLIGDSETVRARKRMIKRVQKAIESNTNHQPATTHD